MSIATDTIKTMPAWATRIHAVGDDDETPWFERDLGRGYYLPGIGLEVHMLSEDEPVTFTLVQDETRSEPGWPSVFVEERGGTGGRAFASADAMRRYAATLIEVADDLDAVLGGTR